MDAAFLDRLPQFRTINPPNELKCDWFANETFRLRYYDSGHLNRRTVVMMPDPPNTIEHMLPLIRDISKDHRIVVFEGPGFGFSLAKKGFHFSIDEQADVIIQLLDHLKIKQSILSLTCVGALSAIHAATKYPTRFFGLVLAQVSSLDEEKTWAKRVDFKKIIGTPVIGQVAMLTLKPLITRNWYKAALPKNSDSTSYVNPALMSFKNGARFSLASSFQQLQNEKNICNVPLTIPAKIVWGTSDRTHRRTDREAIRKILPNVVFRDFVNCGHFPDLERPMDFASEIRNMKI